MSMVEMTPIPNAALPMAALAAHLRLGEHYETLPGEVTRLESGLRGAIAMVERSLGRVVLRRAVQETVVTWSGVDRTVLAATPVSSVTAVTIHKASGDVVALEAGSFGLLADDTRPVLVAAAPLPALLEGDVAKVDYVAGIAANWDAVPDDLAQATLRIAAKLYEANGADSTVLSSDILVLLAPYRRMRLSGARR